MAEPLPKPDKIVLIRYIDDEGTRLEIEPTMKSLTVEGVRYERAPDIRFRYPDGHLAVAYVACVPLKDFARGTLDTRKDAGPCNTPHSEPTT